MFGQEPSFRTVTETECRASGSTLADTRWDPATGCYVRWNTTDPMQLQAASAICSGAGGAWRQDERVCFFPAAPAPGADSGSFPWTTAILVGGAAALAIWWIRLRR